MNVIPIRKMVKPANKYIHFNKKLNQLWILRIVTCHFLPSCYISMNLFSKHLTYRLLFQIPLKREWKCVTLMVVICSDPCSSIISSVSKLKNVLITAIFKAWVTSFDVILPSNPIIPTLVNLTQQSWLLAWKLGLATYLFFFFFSFKFTMVCLYLVTTPVWTPLST